MKFVKLALAVTALGCSVSFANIGAAAPYPEGGFGGDTFTSIRPGWVGDLVTLARTPGWVG